MNITEEEEVGRGSLSDENFLHALTHTKWVTRMACGLELVTLTDDIDEAHAIARDHLGNLVDPMDGLGSGLPDAMRLRWRIASRKRG